jgi:hypothetical protein
MSDVDLSLSMVVMAYPNIRSLGDEELELEWQGKALAGGFERIGS